MHRRTDTGVPLLLIHLLSSEVSSMSSEEADAQVRVQLTSAQIERVARASYPQDTSEHSVSRQRETLRPPYPCSRVSMLLPRPRQREPLTRPSLAHPYQGTARVAYQIQSTLLNEHSHIAAQVPVAELPLHTSQ